MKLKNIVKKYGTREVLDGITLHIDEGKITVILGESGCGKSTLLGILSKNISDYSGEVEYEREINRGISYIFQEDTLIPWKTVYQNIEYVLEGKVPKDEMKKYIEKYLKMVNLEEYAEEYPQALSGGMKRRVGIARAFAFPSDYLFMDEPFEFLDIKTKQEIIKYFKVLQEQEKKTVIFITHDIESALELGEKIVVFSQKPTKIKSILKNDDIKEKMREKVKNLFL